MFENSCSIQAWHSSTSVCHRVLLAYLTPWALSPSPVTNKNKKRYGMKWSSNKSNLLVGNSFGGMWHLTLWGHQPAMWDPPCESSRGRLHVIIQALTLEEVDISERKHTEMLLTYFTLVSFISWRTNAFSQIETCSSIETGCCTVCWNE